MAKRFPLGAKLKLVMANLCKLGNLLITFKSEVRINVTEKSLPAQAITPVVEEISMATTPFMDSDITRSLEIFCFTRSYSKMAAPFPDLNAAVTTTLDSATNLTLERKYFPNFEMVALGAFVDVETMAPVEELIASMTDAVT